MVPQAKLSYGCTGQDGTLKGAPIWGPLSMVQSVVINFSSKVYSKSLLKVWCACVMRISSIPQLQVIHMERLYNYK